MGPPGPAAGGITEFRFVSKTKSIGPFERVSISCTHTDERIISGGYSILNVGSTTGGYANLGPDAFITDNAPMDEHSWSVAFSRFPSGTTVSVNAICATISGLDNNNNSSP
jgi:hypothetical protein